MAKNKEARKAELSYLQIDKIKKTDWAYFAGLFDGEGCIHIGETKFTSKRNGNITISYSLIISMMMCDAEPVIFSYKLLKKVGLMTGKLGRYRRKEISRPYVFQWDVYGKNAGIVLKKMLPYLKGKRRQAKMGIYFAEKLMVGKWHTLPKETREKQKRLSNLLSRTNKKGVYWSALEEEFNELQEERKNDSRKNR